MSFIFCVSKMMKAKDVRELRVHAKNHAAIYIAIETQVKNHFLKAKK